MQFTAVVSLISAESEVLEKSVLVAPEGSSERKFVAFLCSQVSAVSSSSYSSLSSTRLTDLSRTVLCAHNGTFYTRILSDSYVKNFFSLSQLLKKAL